MTSGVRSTLKADSNIMESPLLSLGGTNFLCRLMITPIDYGVPYQKEIKCVTSIQGIQSTSKVMLTM